MRTSFLNTLVLIFATSCSLVFARKGRLPNITCPVLQRCSCYASKYGAVASCSHVSNLQEIDTDLAALEGIFFKTLTFLNVSLTELPVKFLKNRTIHELAIFNCPLRDISETAIGSANRVSSIHLKRSMLNSLPSGLSSAKGLLCIIATLNAFKVLHGSLLLPELRKLDLRYNGIEEVSETYLMGMPKLEHLVLSHNKIHHLSAVLFEKTRNLREVHIGKNRITQLNGIFDGMHSLQVRDAGGITCAESPNTLVSRKDFAGLGQKQLCPAAFPEYAKYLLYVMGVLLVFLTSSAAYFNFERQLKAWLRVRGVCGWLQCVAEEDVDAEKLFDVFLSFSNKDARWVDEQLLSRLEGFGFSCCTYERNFKGGFLLQDIIRDAVACSRWSLLVITQNFVASEWCRWEFRLAHQRALQDNINRLLVVLVDDVASGALDEDLRLYVQAANHLRWGEPNFWERLRRSLLKKDAKRKLIIEQPNSSI
ncbi:protein toll-like isoform X3 [Amblyomma americanum]